MKYKVGDKVKIKEPSGGNEEFDFVEEMEGYIDKIAVIEVIYKRGYAINLDNSMWRWTDEMLEPVSEYPKEMWVWDKNTVDPIVREVVAYAPGIEFPYLTKDKNESNWKYIGYKYAKDLPQPKELTMQEIADKFGINVEQLKIKK